MEKNSTSTIAIAVIAIIIIIILGFLIFYFSIAPVPVAPETFAPIEKPTTPQVIPTDVVVFSVPENLPEKQESGNCFANSIAEPFRKDAWRCIVKNAINDPCFETLQKGIVFCPGNPLKSDFTAIKLNKVLPKLEVPKVLQTNWAWFLVLRDGIYCSPFTGTRPFFGQGPNAKIAYYACNSTNDDQQIVLLGDLAEGKVWKADEAILEKIGANWMIKSTKEVDIDTVWQ